MAKPTPKQLILVIAIGFGLMLLGAGAYYKQSSQMNNAVAVQATVINSEVSEAPSDPDQGKQWEADIKYRYRYQGDSYKSGQLKPDVLVDDGTIYGWELSSGETSYGARTKAEKIVEKYPEGEPVTAHVDPTNPSDSFLIKEYSWLVIGGLFGLGLLSTLGGGLQLVGVPLPSVVDP